MDSTKTRIVPAVLQRVTRADVRRAWPHLGLSLAVPWKFLTTGFLAIAICQPASGESTLRFAPAPRIQPSPSTEVEGFDVGTALAAVKSEPQDSQAKTEVRAEPSATSSDLVARTLAALSTGIWTSKDDLQSHTAPGKQAAESLVVGAPVGSESNGTATPAQGDLFTRLFTAATENAGPNREQIQAPASVEGLRSVEIEKGPVAFAPFGEVPREEITSLTRQEQPDLYERLHVRESDSARVSDAREAVPQELYAIPSSSVAAQPISNELFDETGAATKPQPSDLFAGLVPAAEQGAHTPSQGNEDLATAQALRAALEPTTDKVLTTVPSATDIARSDSIPGPEAAIGTDAPRQVPALNLDSARFASAPVAKQIVTPDSPPDLSFAVESNREEVVSPAEAFVVLPPAQDIFGPLNSVSTKTTPAQAPQAAGLLPEDTYLAFAKPAEQESHPATEEVATGAVPAPLETYRFADEKQPTPATLANNSSSQSGRLVMMQEASTALPGQSAEPPASPPVPPPAELPVAGPAPSVVGQTPDVSPYLPGPSGCNSIGCQGGTEVRAFVPPLACCGKWQSCPSACASNIPLPYVALADPNSPTDPSTAPQWPLTIYEAVGVALSNSAAVRNLGLLDAASDIDKIRARITRYDPLAAAALADAQWGIFDPLWTTNVHWDKTDIPPGTSFSGIGNRPPNLDTADFITSLEQLLPGGTHVSADYVTDYLFNPDNPPGLDPNPQYFSYTQFGVRQPLLRGLGVNVTMAPIRIAAAEAERTDWKFKEEMLALVRSVETAYWDLYEQEENLRTIEEALPFFREVVRIREQQSSGAAGTESEVARARSEMLLFEQRRLQTLSLIAEQQLVLRDLLGLPPNDNRYLKLVALPVTSRPGESVQDAITTAINRRPSVLRQRLSVYVAQQGQVIARDSLRPLLDFNAFWRINGLGDDLGGSLSQIGDNDYNDWQLGVTFQIPLGRRKARGDLRAAEFLIQKERTLLWERAHQTSFEVADAYRRIDWLSQQYQLANNRAAALGQWREGAKAQFENPPPGMSSVFALELYLQNLRDSVDASSNSHAILADFNSALARLEEVKGTLLETRLVEIAGDASENLPNGLPLPEPIMPETMAPQQ